MLFTQHTDNPRLYDEKAGEWTEYGMQYIATLDALTGVRKKRLRYGLWVGAEGMVFSEWDESVHHIDRFEIPSYWQRYRVIDFGFTNPFVCQWWAVDGDGRAYLYREIYHTQRLVEDHARQINALSEGEHYVATIADHDAEDRATLAKHGIGTLPAHKTISTGVEAVNARLKRAGDNKPRLFIMRGSLVGRDERLVEAKKPYATYQEIPGYVYPKGVDGKPLKEDPVKLDDHGCDAMRYFVAHIDSAGRQRAVAYGSTSTREGM